MGENRRCQPSLSAATSALSGMLQKLPPPPLGRPGLALGSLDEHHGFGLHAVAAPAASEAVPCVPRLFVPGLSMYDTMQSNGVTAGSDGLSTYDALRSDGVANGYDGLSIYDTSQSAGAATGYDGSFTGHWPPTNGAVPPEAPSGFGHAWIGGQEINANFGQLPFYPAPPRQVADHIAARHLTSFDLRQLAHASASPDPRGCMIGSTDLVPQQPAPRLPSPPVERWPPQDHYFMGCATACGRRAVVGSSSRHMVDPIGSRERFWSADETEPPTDSSSSCMSAFSSSEWEPASSSDSRRNVTSNGRCRNPIVQRAKAGVGARANIGARSASPAGRSCSNRKPKPGTICFGRSRNVQCSPARRSTTPPRTSRNVQCSPRRRSATHPWISHYAPSDAKSSSPDRTKVADTPLQAPVLADEKACTSASSRAPGTGSSSHSFSVPKICSIPIHADSVTQIRRSSRDEICSDASHSPASTGRLSEPFPSLETPLHDGSVASCTSALGLSTGPCNLDSTNASPACNDAPDFLWFAAETPLERCEHLQEAAAEAKRQLPEHVCQSEFIGQEAVAGIVARRILPPPSGQIQRRSLGQRGSSAQAQESDLIAQSICEVVTQDPSSSAPSVQTTYVPAASSTIRERRRNVKLKNGQRPVSRKTSSRVADDDATRGTESVGSDDLWNTFVDDSTALHDVSAKQTRAPMRTRSWSRRLLRSSASGADACAGCERQNDSDLTGSGVQGNRRHDTETSASPVANIGVGEGHVHSPQDPLSSRAPNSAAKRLPSYGGQENSVFKRHSSILGQEACVQDLFGEGLFDVQSEKAQRLRQQEHDSKHAVQFASSPSAPPTDLNSAQRFVVPEISPDLPLSFSPAATPPGSDPDDLHYWESAEDVVPPSAEQSKSLHSTSWLWNTVVHAGSKNSSPTGLRKLFDGKSSPIGRSLCVIGAARRLQAVRQKSQEQAGGHLTQRRSFTGNFVAAREIGGCVHLGDPLHREKGNHGEERMSGTSTSLRQHSSSTVRRSTSFRTGVRNVQILGALAQHGEDGARRSQESPVADKGEDAEVRLGRALSVMYSAYQEAGIALPASREDKSCSASDTYADGNEGVDAGDAYANEALPPPCTTWPREKTLSRTRIGRTVSFDPELQGQLPLGTT